MFNHLVGLVDGEIESSDKLTIFPRFVKVKLVIELHITWHEVNNKANRTDEDKQSV